MIVVMHVSPEAFPVILMVRVYRLVTLCHCVIDFPCSEGGIPGCDAVSLRHGVQEEFSPNFI